MHRNRTCLDSWCCHAFGGRHFWVEYQPRLWLQDLQYRVSLYLHHSVGWRWQEPTGQGLWECSYTDVNSELRALVDITTSRFDIAKNSHAPMEKMNCLVACIDEADGDVVFFAKTLGDIDSCRGCRVDGGRRFMPFQRVPL